MISRSSNSKKILTEAPSSQIERLSFIEARLYFLGELRRQDVTSRFAVASVQASRDISVYKQLAPKNLVYDYRDKIYLPSDRFKRVKHPASVEADYGMTEGQLQIDCRAAMVGYLLRRWNVDATQDRSLSADEFHLALANPHVLVGIESAGLAPGHKTSRSVDQ